MKGYKLSKYVEKIFETPSSEYSEWFGYYNCDALNSKHTKLLCNRVKEDGVEPRVDLKIEVGYYDIPSGKWHHVGESDSWNWQQGCMAQWLSDDEIIYNSSENNHHIAIIHNIKTGMERKIDWAVYGIMPDGRKSISLDMERAHWCRAYHYQSVEDKTKDGPVYLEDGIFEIDLEHNICKKLISIQDIILLDNRPYFTKAKHWLEHIMINPTGTKFCVLHRFSPIDNVFKYVTRLIIVDVQTLQMECIPNWEKTQWSHFGWDGDNFVIYTYPQIGFGISEEFFNGCSASSKSVKAKKISLKTRIAEYIRQFIPQAWEKQMRGFITYYQYYKLNNGHYEQSQVFKHVPFLIDGHPTFISNRKEMITDTYPDKKRVQRLLLLDMNKDKVIELGKFNAYYRGNPASCDLHPKVSKDGQYIVVDSAHDYKHHMLVLKLKYRH